MQRLADRVSGVFVPDRDRHRGRHARLLDRRRRGPRVRVHRRRRGADHRLPVRARARDADRAARRHRPRRAARPADQGPGDPRVDAPRRHDRARQDRHRDHRPDGARARSSPPTASTRRSCWPSPARSRTPRSTRSRRRSPPRRASAAALEPVESFVNREGLGVEGVVGGRGVQVGRPSLLAEWSLRDPGRARRRPARRRGARAAPPSWSPGTARCAGCWPWPTRSSRPPPRPSQRLHALGLRTGAADRRQRGDRRARSPPRSASTR